MRHRTMCIRSLLAAAVVVGGIGIQIINAADAGFGLTYQKETFPEMGPVTTCLLQDGGDQFKFMPIPRATSTQDVKKRQVDMAVGKEGSIVRLRLWDKKASSKEAVTLDMLKQRLVLDWKKAEVLADFRCYAEAGSGHAFDIKWTDDHGFTFGSRVAYVEVGNKVAEISLIAPWGKLDRYYTSFNGVLMSFQKVDSRG